MEKKYKQIIVPEILTDIKTFKGLSRQKLNLFAEAYYHKNLKGKSVVNKHLGITVNFTENGSRKIYRGSALYPYKAIVLLKIKELMQHAEYNNFGKPKASDPKTLQGYLNFKVKCKINKEIKNFRITVLLYKSNKAFYNHEMNIIKK
jgi:hypothetical protein